DVAGWLVVLEPVPERQAGLHPAREEVERLLEQARVQQGVVRGNRVLRRLGMVDARTDGDRRAEHEVVPSGVPQHLYREGAARAAQRLVWQPHRLGDPYADARVYVQLRIVEAHVRQR